MSYCVHCGVQLEETIKECPLCNTPIINPNLKNPLVRTSPFPTKSGQVEMVKRKDFAILLSTVLLSTSVTCGLLNLLVFNTNSWSLLIIAICALIWVFAIPAIIYTKISIYTSLLLDGVIVGIFLWVITFVTNTDAWFFEIAIPIVTLSTILIETFAFLMRHFRVSYLTTTLYLVIALAILCVGIEIPIDLYINDRIQLTWSAVVLVVSTIIVVALITIISKKRFRETIRRKLHF